MAWERRGNSQYYYRKKRQDGRVVSEYVGSDLTAHLIAEVDRLNRERALSTLTVWQEQRSEFKAMEQEYELLQLILRGLVHAVFLTSGYHTHKGQWRKKRHE